MKPAWLVPSVLHATVALLSASALAEEPRTSYVGAETCAACHEEAAAALAGTVHGRTSVADWEGGVSCESCHGPGSAHAESGDPSKIRVLLKLPEVKQSETCLACHERGGRSHWQGSPHDGRGL